MLPNISQKFQREMRSFNALLIMNIVVGAVGMGMSISHGVIKLLTLTLPLTIDSIVTLPLVALGLVGFGISIKWLISTVEIFSDAQEINEDYDNATKSPNSDATTSLIVKSMSYYRSKKSAIKQMSWVSRIAGMCFIVLAIYGIAASLLGFGEVNLLMAAASSGVNIAIGVVALYIPRSFSNFSSSWDYRLNEGDTAGNALQKVLEGQV